MTPIHIALAKGRILRDVLPMLAAAQIVPREDPTTSHKLIVETGEGLMRRVVVRAADVPTYVQFGAADLGVVG